MAPRGVQNKDIRINWDACPQFTTDLVNLIAANPRYRSALFGNGGDRWVVERELCCQVLKGEPWMRDKEEKGWVRRSGDGWEPTEQWTSGQVHPVRNRVHLLSKRMRDGWYKDKYGIEPTWKSLEDVPTGIRLLFSKDHPYYFTLRQVWNDCVPTSFVLNGPAHAEPVAPVSYNLGESSRPLLAERGPVSTNARLSPLPADEAGDEKDRLSKRPRTVSRTGPISTEEDEVFAAVTLANAATGTLASNKIAPFAATLDKEEVEADDSPSQASPTTLNSSEKRPRGRPRGSTNKKGNGEGEEGGESVPSGQVGKPPTKRGRGRPKGSVNKKRG